MRRITFWFDVVSPYAYLAFTHLPQALEGCSYHVEYRPVLFAGLLKHWGQKGPAEIEPKRAWTFRQVAWWAHRHGIALQVPARHPFNPLPLLRLLLATAGPGRLPNRRAVELVLQHVWAGGGAGADDPARLAALQAELAPVQSPEDAAVKQALHDHTRAAVERGLFGVPTLECDGRLYWGVEGLAMLADALHGGEWFAGTGWDEAGQARPGVQRRP